MTNLSRLSSEYHALLRGWIQGVDWTILGEMYLSDASRQETQKKVKELRSYLAIKAKQLNLSKHEAIWRQDRGYSPEWMEAALKSLDSLSKLNPKPQPDSEVGAWFVAKIACRLNEAGLKTLNDLAAFINDRGAEWWKLLPNFGLKSAMLVETFFESYAKELGIVLDLSKKTKVDQCAIIRISGVAPFERFLLPERMNGSQGLNRAPFLRCKIEANNDYEAIQAWLSLWLTRHQTFRAYRKEAERFLLWAILTKCKAFSSITTIDCAEYLRFLTNPIPEDIWVSQSSDRSSSHWRPFKGALKPISVKHSKIILSSLCDWLVGQRYLDSNPFSGLAYEHYPKQHSVIEKVLPPVLLEKVLAYANQQANNEAFKEDQKRYYQRIHFILLFAYRTGLRLDELVKATTGHIKNVAYTDEAHYWLSVVGKGQKYREVPIPPLLIEQINTHLRERQLSSLEYVSPSTYLIGKIRGDRQKGVTVSSLARTLKSFFREAAKVLGKDDPAIAARLNKTSTHWLRHTHASHAVNRGVSLAIVRDNLGHSDISTTSIYVHAERDERYRAMAGGI